MGDERLRRGAAVAAARHAMTVLGVDWQQVRTWALAHGYMPADVPLRTINPAAVAAYGQDKETP